jgi:hypothetical protein
MRVFTGTLYVVTASFMGYAAFLSMMQAVNGATSFWLDPVALAAAIVLLMAGIKAFSPRLSDLWLVVFSACLPLALCAALIALPARCWVFAGAVATAQWALGWSGKRLNRDSLSAFLAGSVLLVSWTVVEFKIFNFYLNSSTMRLSAYLVIQAVLFWLLLAGVVMRSAYALFRRPQPTDRSSGSVVSLWRKRIGGFYKRQCQEKTLFPTRRGEIVLVIEPLSPMMIVRFGQE